MSLISNLSIRLKILAIVVGGIVGIVVILAFNYNATSQNKVTLEQVRNIYFPVLERLDASLVRLDKMKESYSSAVISGEEEILEDIATLAMVFVDALNEVAVLDIADKGDVDQILLDFGVYMKSADAVSRGMIEDALTPDDVQPMLKAMNNDLNSVQVGLNRFRNHAYQRFTGALDEANEASEYALFIGGAIGVGVALLLGMSGLFISNAITSNLMSVIHSLKDMASGDGDLTQRLTSASNDEVGALVEGFNHFVSKLQGVIIEVSGSTEQVTVAAMEMKRCAGMGVRGMDLQQEEIAQVVTAMGEMTDTVDSVANSAGQAANVANTVSAEASAGKRVVEENMQAIGCLASEVEQAAEVIKELESHSESIGQVLNVIQEIAEQTNLLALNAAIEAARAGEQGRGFAVVADEVRTLATRTHESTREINDMISRLQTGTQNAVKSMMQGTEQAQVSVARAMGVGEALERITQGIVEISDMNVQIASAAEEQSAVSREINTNIINLGKVANQVTEDAHTAERESEKLAGFAQQLEVQVSTFKV